MKQQKEEDQDNDSFGIEMFEAAEMQYPTFQEFQDVIGNDFKDLI